MQKLSRRQLARYVASELAGGKTNVSDLAQHIAAYLSEHKALKSTDLLLRDVSDVLAKEYGQLNVEVISARELSATLREHITRYAAERTGVNNVELKETTDPSLIGGVIVRLPGEELDASIRTKLSKLRSV